MFRDESDKVVQKAMASSQTGPKKPWARLEKQLRKGSLSNSLADLSHPASSNGQVGTSHAPRVASQSYNVTSRLGSRLKHHSGVAVGLRINTQLHSHPFNSIESYSGPERTRVLRCLDYYVSFCGPNYVWRDEAIVTGSIHHFAQDFFQLSLAEPALLETVLAICQADLDLRHESSRPPSVPVLRHRDRALRFLRHGLSSAESADDKAITVAVVGLITLDMIFGDWASYQVHLSYLRALLGSRGGIESLGWQGWFSYAYTWAELRWATQMARRARVGTTESCLATGTQSEARPLRVKISVPTAVPPVGFQELADAGLLNATIVELLGQVAGWVGCSNGSCDGTISLGQLNIQGLALAADFARLISTCVMTELEILLCIAVVAYIVSFIEGPEGHSRGLEDLTADLDLFDLGPFDTPLCLWMATVIAGANPTVPAPLVHRWTLIDQVMAMEDTVTTWPEALLIFDKFFWTSRHEAHWQRCWNTALERNAVDKK